METLFIYKRSLGEYVFWLLFFDMCSEHVPCWQQPMDFGGASCGE